VGAVIWEALHRLSAPEAVATRTVILVAAIGIFINGLTAMMFMSGRRTDLNIRGAFTHMAADALISVAVVVGGLLMYATGLYWIDPLLSLIISFVIVFGTWTLFRDSLRLILQAVPVGTDPVAIRKYLESLPGVARIHDLHIWGMSTTENALTVHLVVPEGSRTDEFLLKISQELLQRFAIHHSTIQIEVGSQSEVACPLEPDEVV
jgi:cobalt-zinc-cadmium efflux system protein